MDTEKAPASLTLIGIPDEKSQTNKYAIEFPYVLGLIATRSIDKPVEGITELVEQGKGSSKMA